MIKDQEIREYISKACNFLVNNQEEDGSWSMISEKLKEPPSPYKNPLILTSQSLQSLIFGAKPEYISYIKKSLNFCLNSELNREESIDLWAWKLAALRFTDTRKSIRLKNEIIKLIEEKQENNGSWPYYPNTFTLTNYSVCNSLTKKVSKETIKKAVNWFKTSKKRKGWSRNDKDDNIEPSFTANAILSMMRLGEKPDQEVISYLESEQKENGGWIVLSDSSGWENITSYSTALCTSALILTGGDKEKIEKGIEFLLKCQDTEGRILRNPKEKETYYYLFYYVIKALELYLFSKGNNPDLCTFEEERKQNFLFLCYKNVLTSRALGVTKKSRIRRKDIIKSLEESPKEVAEIIDYLKKDKRYSHLNKKSHITQIKSDVEYLRSIKMISKYKNRYYASISLI